MSVSIREITQKFGTQRKCIKYLEKLRWGTKPQCPYCLKKKNKPAKGENFRYGCRNCGRTFSVFIDTIFQDTRLPLPDWFLMIALMLNAKSGMSVKEIQRHMGLKAYETAYYIAMRIRIGMLESDTELGGIIEMDESYFGGMPRKNYNRQDKSNTILSQVTSKRGRGTKKTSVVGMVQRKGKVKTKVVEKLSKRNLMYMLRQYAKPENAILVTDGFKSYKGMSEYIDRLEVIHSKQFSKGIVHVNTIEGYWAFVKNGIKGNYKAISPKYLPFYLVEYEWKYNHRLYKGDQFAKYLKNALSHEKELEYGKAQTAQEVKDIAYE